MEIIEQNVLGVLLFAARLIGEFPLLLRETPRVRTRVRLSRTTERICSVGEDTIRERNGGCRIPRGAFLLNYGDEHLMDFIYPQKLNNIQRVEQIISYRLLGEKRKRQRDRMSSGRQIEHRRHDFRVSRRRYS